MADFRTAVSNGADQVAKIAASMAEFGWTVPCLVGEDGDLIAGHGRVLAATQLGLAPAERGKDRPRHPVGIVERVEAGIGIGLQDALSPREMLLRVRTLHVSDIGAGLEVLYAEITELAPNCRFRDCTHAHEPGCAVLLAVAAGDIPADRLDRWRKLHEENRANTSIQTGPRGNRTEGPPGRRH